MKNLTTIIINFFLLTNIAAQKPAPPVTQKIPKIFTEHGNTRTDDYFWLSDPLDKNVIDHLTKENEYTKDYLAHTEQLQQKIYKEIIARIPGKDVSLPVKKNGYWYYTRFEKENQYPYYTRKKGSTNAKEEMLLDIPTLAKNHQIYLVNGWSVSRNNQYIAYAIDTAGNRRSTLYFKDLLNNKILEDKITNTEDNCEWANDNKTIFYVINDHTVRPYKVMKHTLGEPLERDKEIYTETDSTFSVSLSNSKNNKYIFIHINSTNTSEDRYIDADNPHAEPVIIQPRKTGLEYSTNYYEKNIFHIRTNKDAKNFKLVSAPIENPSMEFWKDVIATNENSYLESAVVLKDYYVVQAKENGLSQVNIYDRQKNKWKKINFGQEDYVAIMNVATDDYNTDSIRYYFASLSTPASTFRYNLKTGASKLLKTQKVGGGFDPSFYATKRLWSTSADGTKVPLSLVYRKDKFTKDGSKPMLLYAYGSYGLNIDPYFNSSIISLLDRGISFAIAHIRGGQEMGRDWFEQGRLLNKKNTFTDFIDAAKFLIKEKYTSADKLFANGGSAGGMLMGAITNMRPDLFRGVIAEVPWMDVITDMYNSDLPLTTGEYDQWGDPNVKEYYDYMLSWSPQDNVKPANYPAILATGGLNDTQVPYYSPAKWVAKVRDNNTGTNPVLLKINLGAGHGGESGRYERQKITALKYAFILDILGRKE